ncbi:hypothetical protein Q7P35_007899 [Cladosporium inversicolor]
MRCDVLCFYTWRFGEKDISPFDDGDEDRDSLLRLPLYSAMAAITLNLACSGRAAKDVLLVITSTLFEPSLVIATGTVSLFSLCSSSFYFAQDALSHATTTTIQHMDACEIQRVMLACRCITEYFAFLSEQDIRDVV